MLDRLPPGTIFSADITVPDAEGLRDFYAQVIGWEYAPLDVGGYDDYVMKLPGSDEQVAGVCHARGENLGLPPVWLIYVVVEDLDVSMRTAQELGGEAVGPARGDTSSGRFQILKDPSGGHVALFQPGTEA